MATPYTPPQPNRPTGLDVAQAGNPSFDIGTLLQNQISLAEGLQQASQARFNATKAYTQGPGQQAVTTLAAPSNRAFGESPVAGLSSAVDLNTSFGRSLDTGLAEQQAASRNVLDIIGSLQRVKTDEESARREEERLKLDKQKFRADLLANGLETDENGDIIVSPAAKGKKTEKQLEAVDKLRTEYISQGKVNEFITVKNAYQKVAGAENTAAGDLGLIFNFMKILDPGSTVREGEFANAQNSAGVPDQIKNIYNKIQSGQRLNPSQRADFKRQAANQFNSHIKTQKELSKFYESQAKQRGLDPQDIIGVIGPLEEVVAPALAGDKQKTEGFLNSFLNSMFGIPAQRPPLSSFEE